jgi:uncharacterized protein (UPF0332 family)
VKEYSRKLLDKAEHAIEVAEKLLAGGDPGDAIGKGYYALFHATRALLHDRDIKYAKRHGGVHAAFGQYFAKTRELDPKYHRW